MKAIDGYRLITPGELAWRPSNLMGIPNADYLERTGSEILGARLWRLPPNSANTLHKHVRAEEFYFVLEGVGRLRVGEETLTVPRLGGVLVGPSVLRQIFNDSDSEVLWLVVGVPDKERASSRAASGAGDEFVHDGGKRKRAFPHVFAERVPRDEAVLARSRTDRVV